MFEILIIDDDAMTRLLLQKTLQKQGYQVSVAADGEEGIRQATQIKPALIICDWMMPQMDGLEVCRSIKANPALSTTFFILLTAKGATEDRIQGLDNGADDFLAKPIEMGELKARVRAGLRLYQLNRDLQKQKQILEAELAEAADYVRSLLPAPLTGKIQTATRFVPSRQLGGDCFDFHWLNSDEIAIYLLDVSGHGLGAALLSVSVLNLMRSQSLPGVNFHQPAHVLSALNEAFQMGAQNDKYFTIWYGVYSISTRQLRYCSAGHPPAILVTGTTPDTIQVQHLKTPGLPIGMFPDVEFTNASCEIAESSTLYIFSDGIYEINQPDGSIWGLEAFVRQLVEQQMRQSPDLDHLLRYVQAVSTTPTLEDDLSLIQVQL